MLHTESEAKATLETALMLFYSWIVSFAYTQKATFLAVAAAIDFQ
jgi:hypothetical protein